MERPPMFFGKLVIVVFSIYRRIRLRLVVRNVLADGLKVEDMFTAAAWKTCSQQQPSSAFRFW